MSAAGSICLGVVTLLVVGRSAANEPRRLCELAMKHGGLAHYRVQVEPDKNGNRIVRADIDLDGSDDRLQWFDGGSASFIPADPTTLTLTLSSNNQEFKLQQQRLYVVKFESRYYVVTTRAETQLGPWYLEVFALDRNGITNVCSYEGKGQLP